MRWTRLTLWRSFGFVRLCLRRLTTICLRGFDKLFLIRILVLFAGRLIEEGLRRTDRLADFRPTRFLLGTTEAFGLLPLPPIRGVLFKPAAFFLWGPVTANGDLAVFPFFLVVTDGFGLLMRPVIRVVVERLVVIFCRPPTDGFWAVILPPIREVLAVDTIFRELITVGLFRTVTEGFWLPMRPVLRVVVERLVVIFFWAVTGRLTVTFVDLRTGAFAAGRLM